VDSQTATITVLTVEPITDLGITIAVDRSAITLGESAVVQIVVTNLGPSEASGAAVDSQFPGNTDILVKPDKTAIKYVVLFVLIKQQQLIVCLEEFYFKHPPWQKINLHLSGKGHVIVENRNVMSSPDVSVYKDLFPEPPNDIK
jgi:hypothetical protein